MQNKDLWVGIGKQILSFVIGVIAAAFILGGARQRVNDVYGWKQEIAPRIERMDASGTLSFSHFHQEYERTQSRQEKRLEQLEKDVRELQINRKAGL